jgi:hypothetical protein
MAHNTLRLQAMGRGENDAVMQISIDDVLTLGAGRHFAGGGEGDDDARVDSEEALARRGSARSQSLSEVISSPLHLWGITSLR